MRLMELLFEFLTKELRLDSGLVAKTLWRDYQRGGRHDKPGFLAEFLTDEAPIATRRSESSLKRQSRHVHGAPVSDPAR